MARSLVVALTAEAKHFWSRRPGVDVLEVRDFMAKHGELQRGRNVEMPPTGALLRVEPHVDVYQHRKTGDFKLVNFSIDPEIGGLMAWGPMIPIDRSDMMENGLSIVLRNLQGFETRRIGQPAELDSLNKQERRQFFLNHSCVAVVLLSEHQLSLMPVRGDPSIGFSADRIESSNLRLPNDQREFWVLLTQVIEKAESEARS